MDTLLVSMELTPAEAKQENSITDMSVSPVAKDVSGTLYGG